MIRGINESLVMTSTKAKLHTALSECSWLNDLMVLVSDYLQVLHV